MVSRTLEYHLTLNLSSRAILSFVDECCCPSADPQAPRSCPSCDSRTVPVHLATVKALLTSAALAHLDVVTYRFCPDPLCDVVYVADTGHVFLESDIRVPVWQKLPPGGRTLCYCFGENERDMQLEIALHGSTSALTRVRTQIAERRCACHVRNPRGTCCLVDLTAVVTRLQEAQRSTT